MYKLSIITVCYNSANTIEDTIKSIVNQKTEQMEYIIVDGKSTDNTLDIVDKYRSQIDVVISESDCGISDAFNKGIKIAKGEYIGIINSDDMLLPNAFEIFRNEINNNTDVFFGRGIRLYPDGTCKEYKIEKNPQLLHRGMPFCHPAVFVKKEAYERWGMFDISYKCVMDRELLLRMLNNGARFQASDSYFAVYRMGGASDAGYLSKVLPEIYRIDIEDGRGICSATLSYCRNILLFFAIKIRDKVHLDNNRKNYHDFFEVVSDKENRKM